MNKMLRHDVLNKLGVIRGFLELLLDSYDRDMVEKAIAVTDEAVKIIDRMRELEKTLIGSELWASKCQKSCRRGCRRL